MDVLLPRSRRGPGVLVAHPWWGLNQTIRDYGAALAAEGFVVGLPDLFDGGIATTIEDAERQMRANFETGGARLRQAIAELVAHPAVDGKAAGAVGFSYGGFHLLSLLSDASLPLRAVVAYYATHPLPAAHVRVMAHLAEDDPYETAEDMEALRTALAASGPPNIAHTYPGTKHWFAEADRPEFDAAAAKLAFEWTVEFLKR
jgi:carboxymethylenebutenolidase